MRLTSMLLAVVFAFAACGDSTGNGGGGGGCTPSATQVCMTAATFNPTNLTIAAGGTVTWRDGSGIAHTVTSNPGSAETYNLSVSGSGTATRQFSTAGTFNYHCTIHGTATSGMRGTITVN